MKKIVKMVFVLLIVSMLATANVFAAAPQQLDVQVRNSTGVTVELSLTDGSGLKQFYTVPPSTSDLTLTEGVYEFYAVLPCGTAAGSWNLNVVKVLHLTCAKGVPQAYIMFSQCIYFGKWDNDFQQFLDGYNPVSEPDFYLGNDDGNHGPECLDKYMDAFFSLPGWQLRDSNGDLISEDPDYDFGS